MSRAEGYNKIKYNSVTTIEQQQMQNANRKKGVIMEMEEEYSGSENGISNFNVNYEKATWQEMQDENNQMKTQILNQIAIFEQYLKVATLQHKARQIADIEEAKRLGVRHSS